MLSGIRRHTNHRLKGDRSIVMAAIQNCWLTLEHASDEMKGDCSIVMAAVQQCCLALKHASNEMKGDRSNVCNALVSEQRYLHGLTHMIWEHQ